MAKCYLNNNFFDFIIRKEIPFECLEEDFANFAGEDSFNSEVAEKALDIAFELYPDKPGEDEDDTMDKRHEFVSEFLEYARCEVVKKWAKNLGMSTQEQVKQHITNQAEISKEYWQRKFKRMSCYEFSAWKLGVPADDKDNERIMEQVEDSIFYDAKYSDADVNPDYFDPCELDITIDNSSQREPQDSEDECWEQMKVFQKDIPDSLLKDN